MQKKLQRNNHKNKLKNSKMVELNKIILIITLNAKWINYTNCVRKIFCFLFFKKTQMGCIKIWNKMYYVNITMGNLMCLSQHYKTPTPGQRETFHDRTVNYSEMHNPKCAWN